MRAAILSLLLCSAAAADDAHAARYKMFFKEEIAGRWAAEELSEQRVVMLRGFEKHDLPEAARWIMLEVLPNEPAGDVLREGVRVLSKYRNPDTIAEMATLWEKKLKRDWEAQALSLMAFARIKLDTARKPITLGLDSREPAVVVAACRAAGVGRHADLRPELEKLAEDREPLVRAAAISALGALGGDASLPLIFEAFCGDRSHRVRHDAWRALKTLTLEDLPCDPHAWQDVWGKIKESAPDLAWGPAYPKPRPKAKPAATFFKIPVLADRICFVIDVSLDMKNPWSIDIATERKKEPEERVPNFFNVKTRWDLVRAYLKRCLKNLPEDTEFAVVFYSHEIATFPEKRRRLLKNKSRTHRDLSAFLEEVKVSGSTAMYEGLQTAWGFLREGDPEYNLEKGCDTIVFVTDGRPTHGELKNRADRLRDEVWRAAVPRNLRVHTVGIHYHEYELLKAMAKDTGGLYVHAQQHGDTAEPQDLDFWPRKKKAFEEERKRRKQGSG